MGLVQAKTKPTFAFSEEVKFFDYMPSRKEYIIANRDIIVATKLDGDTERKLFDCAPYDLIKSVQYRPVYDDLIVATKNELFLCSVANAVKKVLHAIPQNQYIRSITQLPYNRLLMMTNDHVRYWDFESNTSFVLEGGDGDFKLVPGDMNRQRLLFTKDQYFMICDLEARSCAYIDMKNPILSALYKNGSLYAMSLRAILHYDIERDISKRLIDTHSSLRSFSCNNDGTKLLMRTRCNLILYDIINSQKTILNTDIFNENCAANFYDKDENQYILRTSDRIELRNILTNSAKVLFKKDKNENSLFTVHHNRARDELLIATMRRAIIVSLKNQKTYELETLPNSDYIKSIGCDATDSYVHVGSIKNIYVMHDLADLEKCKQLEFEQHQEISLPAIANQIVDQKQFKEIDPSISLDQVLELEQHQKADLSITVAQINQEACPSVSSEQLKEYEELFEEHDARADAPSSINNYHILITGCVAFVSWFMNSAAWIY